LWEIFWELYYLYNNNSQMLIVVSGNYWSIFILSFEFFISFCILQFQFLHPNVVSDRSVTISFYSTT
jgi:hypothetical protein